jgi:signal transduction histidine kinase
LGQEDENISMIAYGLGLRAYAYSYSGRVGLAEKPMIESAKLLKQIGNLYSVINVMSAEAKYYASTGQPDKGIQVCQEALAILVKYPVVSKEIIYNQLAANYKAKGDYKKYAQTLNTIIALKDSTYKKNSAEALAMMTARYDVTKEEAFIAKQKLELLNKDIWMASGGGGVLFIIATGYFLFRRYRRRQRVVLYEAGEKERRRIAADLHDNIGAYASAISAGIEEIENKKLITDPLAINYLKSNVSEITTSLRDTIWAFNKDSITLTGISDRIKNYSQKMKGSYPNISIKVEENIKEDKNLSPVQALHVFRIVQEAMHNALHHSHCNILIIKINCDHEIKSISIEDDGDGFDLEAVANKSNGLSNMKTRSAEAGFIFSVRKALPKGSIISILS